MQKILIAIALTVSFTFKGFTQLRTSRSFSFLNTPYTSKQQALGGELISYTKKHEVSRYFYANPALLSSSNSNDISISYQFLSPRVKASYIGYTTNYNKIGNIGIGLYYVNYGEVEGYDETGKHTGNFRSNSFASIISWGWGNDTFSIGSSLKYTLQNIAGYKSSALFFDFGGLFVHPIKELSVGITFRNIGFPLAKSSTEKFTMPVNILLGTTFKPANMPVRFNVVAQQLHTFKIINSASSEAELNLFGEWEENNQITWVDHLLGHFNLGIELVAGKNIGFLVGYDVKNRIELKLENASRLTGFSLGLALHLKKLDLTYAYKIQHIAGKTNQLTLHLNPKDLITKNNSIL